jgi:hypothetical protein
MHQCAQSGAAEWSGRISPTFLEPRASIACGQQFDPYRHPPTTFCGLNLTLLKINPMEI